jgi:hypothetical protein
MARGFGSYYFTNSISFFGAQKWVEIQIQSEINFGVGAGMQKGPAAGP